MREAERVQNYFLTAPDALEGARAFIERRVPRFERIGEGSPGESNEPSE